MGLVCPKEFTAVVADVENFGFDSEPLQVSADYSRNKRKRKTRCKAGECVALQRNKLLCAAAPAIEARNHWCLVVVGRCLQREMERAGRKEQGSKEGWSRNSRNKPKVVLPLFLRTIFVLVLVETGMAQTQKKLRGELLVATLACFSSFLPQF